MSQTVDLIGRFANTHVLVIGDTIIDEYVYGTVLGTSSETPTLVAKELETKRFLGGAFLVCRHLLALGARVYFCTLLGDDAAASEAWRFAHDRFTLLSLDDADRRTTVKRRFWVDGYKLLQLDHLDGRPYVDVERVLARLEGTIDRCDRIVISDNRHGLLSPEVIAAVMQRARSAGKQVYVDSQVAQATTNHALYRGAELCCLNLKEASAIANRDWRHPDAGVEELAATLGIPNVIIKLGAGGAVAWLGEKRWRSQAIAVNAVDTCGAGDAFLAALSLCGVATPEASLHLANHWAGLSTTIHGTTPPERDDLVNALAGEAR